MISAILLEKKRFRIGLSRNAYHHPRLPVSAFASMRRVNNMKHFHTKSLH